jgi:hypothetical protein
LIGTNPTNIRKVQLFVTGIGNKNLSDKEILKNYTAGIAGNNPIFAVRLAELKS